MTSPAAPGRDPTAYRCWAGWIGAGAGAGAGAGVGLVTGVWPPPPALVAPGAGLPNSSVKYSTPLGLAFTLMPIWVNIDWRMFARWPGEFIHAAITSAAPL